MICLYHTVNMVGMFMVAYHGYAITDFYNIDRRFGFNDDYRYLVEKAHKIGIKVVMDVVHNHVGSKHWWFLDPLAAIGLIRKQSTLERTTGLLFIMILMHQSLT